MRRLLPFVVLAIVLFPTPVVPAAPPAPAEGYEEGIELFRFQDDRITESSGVGASSSRDDVFFTHNDSGDSARFFAVDHHGCTLVTYNLPGVEANDWEDMARDPGDGGRPSLFFGDVGDNLHTRAEGVSIYRVPEPPVTPRASADPAACPPIAEQAIEFTRFDLRYEDEPHDVETLLVHPKTGQLFVVTKTYWNDTALYAAPNPLRADVVNVLEHVVDIEIPPSTTIGDGPIATAGRLATTGGDVASRADRVVIRTYTDAWEWRIPGGELPAAFLVAPEQVLLPPTMQGEAIAYTRDGSSLVATTEGEHAPVHLMRG